MMRFWMGLSRDYQRRKILGFCAVILPSMMTFLRLKLGSVLCLSQIPAEAATLETEKLIVEKEKLKNDLRNELQARAIVDLKLDVSQPEWSMRSHLVQVLINMRNLGNRLEVMKLQNPPLRIYVLKLGRDGAPDLVGPLVVSQITSPSSSHTYFMSPGWLARVDEAR